MVSYIPTIDTNNFQTYLTHKWSPNRYYDSVPSETKSNGNEWVTPYSSELPNWSLTPGRK